MRHRFSCSHFFFSFFLDCIIYIRIYVIDNALCTHVLFFLTITLTSRVIYCFFSAFFRDTYLFLYLILQTVIVYAVFFFFCSFLFIVSFLVRVLYSPSLSFHHHTLSSPHHNYIYIYIYVIVYYYYYYFFYFFFLCAI